MSLIALVMMTVLVVSEWKRSKNPGGRSCTAVVMIGSAFACALYGFAFVRTMIAVVADMFEIGEELAKSLVREQGSGTGLVIKCVLLGIMLIPMAAGAVYILVRFIRSSSENAGHTAALSIIAAVLMLIGAVSSLLLTLPHWKQLISEYFVLLHPVVLFFLIVFTGGILLFCFAIGILVEHYILVSILTFGCIFAVTLLVWSAAMGIAASVCAYRSGKAKMHESVMCGIFSVFPVWNIVPMIYLKKKLKD